MSTALEEMREAFPVILVTGARQVGKTTLLKNDVAGARYFTLDDYVLLESIERDEIGFVRANAPPMIIDEIQYLPGLMRSIKIQVDETDEAGGYFLTGSQQFQLMRGVSESLVGRIGILNLAGLSSREIDGDPFRDPFLPSDGYLESRGPTASEVDVRKLWGRIHRGCMPGLYGNKGAKWEQFYSSYVRTYVERDVRALTQVGDELAFMRFLTACAARTGELLNLSKISSDVGISEPTAKRWLSILQASDIVYLLQPLSNNITSRVVKTPKMYFMDTGLAAYLCRWLTPETLENGAMAGAMFETHVVTEAIKSYRNAGREPPIYFYRDSDKREIDLVIEQDGVLCPIEIKKTSSPSAHDAKHFEALKRLSPSRVAGGAVICTYGDVLSLDGSNKAVPVSYI